MAEINKLSVGQVLDKLRSTDAPKSKIKRLDEKTEVLEQEIQRLRAAKRRLARNQQATRLSAIEISVTFFHALQDDRPRGDGPLIFLRNSAIRGRVARTYRWAFSISEKIIQV